MSYSIKNSIIRSVDGRVKYRIRSEGGRKHFHVGVWLDGTEQELDDVREVRYTLHTSFKKPVRSSANRPNKFSITFWTWGMFAIGVEIIKRSGDVEKMEHYLKYDLPQEADAYIDVSS